MRILSVTVFSKSCFIFQICSVVTGLRFRKFSNSSLIFIQIQQGQMLKGGTIDASSVHWEPMDVFRRNDDGVQDGVDYHMLTNEKRMFNTDDLENGDNYVVTGVKLRLMDNHLILSAHFTELDIESDQPLNVESGRWLTKVHDDW